jgi:hypothetical protein
LDAPSAHSLLRNQPNFGNVHHLDSFAVTLGAKDFAALPASRILELTLEGFLNDAPRGVSRLMIIRNLLVAPLGLATCYATRPTGFRSADRTASQLAGSIGLGKIPAAIAAP